MIMMFNTVNTQISLEPPEAVVEIGLGATEVGAASMLFKFTANRILKG